MVRRTAVAAALAFACIAAPTSEVNPRPDESDELADAAVTTEHIVVGLVAAIGRSKVPLPRWALETVEKVHARLEIRRISRKTEKLENEVLEVLRVVTDLRDQLAAGRIVSGHDARPTWQLLQALIERIDAIEVVSRHHADRIQNLEARKKAIEDAVRRPGCGVGRYWSPLTRECVERVSTTR